MDQEHIIIIGAGASGLIAGRMLSRAGKKVTILEARSRPGGRIYTLVYGPFSNPVEAGAEFIHGRLPITFELLQEAKIKPEKVKGNMISVVNGRLKDNHAFSENDALFKRELKSLVEDIPVDLFLDTHFPGEKHAAFRKEIRGFVEGYDAADASRASTFALRDEWLTDDDKEQFRIPGGYNRLVSFLVKECEKNGAKIHYSSTVRNIDWVNGHVTVTTEQGTVYEGMKSVVTLPLGVLVPPGGGASSITFTPAVSDHMETFRKLGYGTVIKTALEFESRFWAGKEIEERTGIRMENTAFIFSDESVPAWWDQRSPDSTLLTGWMAGPRAMERKYADDETILAEAISSLANIFREEPRYLTNRLKMWKVVNWGSDPLSMGAYSYSTVNSLKSIHFLQKPAGNTIFFAGEALYTGTARATVEAALESGIHAAGSILTPAEFVNSGR